MDLSATITKCLCIQGNNSHDSQTLRDIVIIGHSVKSDLKIVQRLGIKICETVPILAILDTHLIVRNLLVANSTFLKGTAPMTSFNLGALLTRLKCPYENSDLHNAGNDATLTLHAILMLAIKSSESRESGFIEAEFRMPASVSTSRAVRMPTLETNSNSLGFLCTRVSQSEKIIANWIVHPDSK